MLSGVTLITHGHTDSTAPQTVVYADSIGDVLIAGSPFEGQELAASNNFVDANGLGPLASAASYSPDYTTINERNFGYYVPESYDPSTPTPLLFMFHGMGGNSSEQSGGSAENGYYGWQTSAHENGFIVLFPESLGYFKTWDLGAGGTSSDLYFVDDMIDWATTNYNISTSQIFTTGHSWGAYFSYYVARYRSDDIAAFASHSGGLGGSFFLGSTPPVPTGPSPTPTLNGIVLHAVDDGLVPYSNSQDLYDDLLDNGHNVYDDGIGDDGIIEVDGWGPDNHRYRLQHNQTQWDFFLEVSDDDVPLVLDLGVADASIAEGAGAAATTATVTRSDPRGNLTVTLTSDDLSEATVPATITLLDGQSSATFDVAAVDDSNVDGTQTVTISAAAAGYPGASETLAVTDDDVPLVLNLGVADASIAEGAGAAATTATVTRSDPRGNLTVTLTSDDVSEATIPAQVTFLDGESSATFDVAAVDDSNVDGTQTVTISAAAAGYPGASETLAVTDDDVPLVLNLGVADASVSEGAGAAATTATVTRTDPRGNLTVMLTSDDVSEATIPAQVTFLDGESSATFDVAAVDDSNVDGTQTVTISAAAAGYPGASETLAVTDDDVPLVLNLGVADASVSEGAGAAATTATVTRTDPRGDLTITLASDDVSEAIVPATVTLLDGQSSATFDVAAVDDSNVDGTQNVTISAAAAGYPGASETLAVTDDDVPLVLNLGVADASIAEGAGAAATTATVTRSDPRGNLTVTLTSDDVSEATIPAQVTFLDGESSATFDVAAVDDSNVDGTQTVTISAAAAGYPGASETLAVTDDDVPLVLNLGVADASVSEGAGAAATTATVTRTDPRGDLTITLASDDVSEAIVPATVTLLDGQSSATFDVAAVDDSNVDGTQTVTISAAAAGYPGASETLAVTDDDVPLVLNLGVADASVSEGAGAAATTATVTRTDPRGDLTITLASDDVSEAIVPATVTMLDGVSSATVDIAAVDDSDVDGTQTVTISAVAAGYTGASGTLAVTDDDVPLVLSLAIADASVSEGAGAAATTATVTRTDPRGNLTVMLTSDDVSEAIVPATVTMLDGVSSATVDIAAVDDSDVDGTQTVTFSAAAAGYTGASGTLAVTDDDVPLVLSLAIADASVSEGAGAAATTATVTRTDPRGNLTVMLTSDDVSEAIVPATVTMLDGVSSATVDIAAVDDSDVDGTQTVTFSAAAAGYTGASGTLAVTDDDVPVIEVLDNGESGFTQTGFAYLKSSQVAAAVGGDVHQLRQGSGLATWTFNDLESGEYRVAATWAGKYDNRYNALDAPFSIENGSGSVLASTTVNQQNAPSEFTYGGYGWETLGTVSISGGSLVVHLGVGSDSIWYSVADAVRVERVGDVSPTLTLSIADASVSEAAGAAATTATVTRTDTNGNLVVSLASDNVSEATAPATVTILDGQSSASFEIAAVDDSAADGTQTVTLSAAATGYIGASGTLEVTDDEASLVTILDNGESGFTQTGFAYLKSSQVAAAVGGDVHQLRQGSGLATWTFNDLESGEYRVAATWAGKYDNRYNTLDAPFSIENGSGSVLASTTVNQQNAPSEFTYGGYGWETLGTVSISGGSLVVHLGVGSDSDWYSVADAVRVERVGDVSPTLTLSIADASVSEAAGVAATTATVTRTDTNGNLVVSLASDNVSEATVPATVTLLDGENSASFEIAAVDDSAADGTQTVTLSAAATGYIGASGTLEVTDDEASLVTILDNGESGFTQTGFAYLKSSQVAAAVGGDVHHLRQGSGLATWTFNDLESGEYRVAATWAGKYDNRYNALDAPFSIENGSGSVLASTTVNQQNAPSEFTYGGYGWETLGTVSISGGTLVVHLGVGSDSNWYSVADAVRVERVDNGSAARATTVVDANEADDFTFEGPLTAAKLVDAAFNDF